MLRINHIVCGMAVGAVTAASSAGPVVFNLNFEISGASPPAGALPWMTITFTQNVSDVDMLIQNNLVGTEWVGRVLVNVDPTQVANPSLLANMPSNIGGTAADGGVSGKATNPASTAAFKADGDGFFDYRFDWSSKTFGGVQTSTYKFSNMTNTWFNVLSEPGGGNGQHHAAAHIQSIGAGGAGSGWIADSPPPIPLPTAAGMAFAGLFGLGCVRRRRSL